MAKKATVRKARRKRTPASRPARKRALRTTAAATNGNRRALVTKAAEAALAIAAPQSNGNQTDSPVRPRRLLPIGEELKNLYARYAGGRAFDDHDKAFYFVLDVGGLSRARQLIQHVEEVLAELEEFQG
jgi:hypothetical protein